MICVLFVKKIRSGHVLPLILGYNQVVLCQVIWGNSDLQTVSMLEENSSKSDRTSLPLGYQSSTLNLEHWHRYTQKNHFVLKGVSLNDHVYFYLYIYIFMYLVYFNLLSHDGQRIGKPCGWNYKKPWRVKRCEPEVFFEGIKLVKLKRPHTSFHPKWWFGKGNPLISGKFGWVKYYIQFGQIQGSKERSCVNRLNGSLFRELWIFIDIYIYDMYICIYLFQVLVDSYTYVLKII